MKLPNAPNEIKSQSLLAIHLGSSVFNFEVKFLTIFANLIELEVLKGLFLKFTFSYANSFSIPLEPAPVSTLEL